MADFLAAVQSDDGASVRLSPEQTQEIASRLNDQVMRVTVEPTGRIRKVALSR